MSKFFPLGRSSYFEKGRNGRESLLNPVVSFDMRNLFRVLATPLKMYSFRAPTVYLISPILENVPVITIYPMARVHKRGVVLLVLFCIIDEK